MFAAGKCWKKDGWIISVYQGVEDPYVTLKLRKMKTRVDEKLTETRKICVRQL